MTDSNQSPETPKNIAAVPSTFGGRLRAERKRLGYSINGFAQLVGIRRLAQSNYEHDHTSPTVAYLLRLKECVDIDLAFVISGTSPAYCIDFNILHSAFTTMFKVTKESKHLLDNPDTLFGLCIHLWKSMMEEEHGYCPSVPPEMAKRCQMPY